MSNISLAIDSIVTKMGDTFTAKSKIPNPYSLKDNPKGCLDDAYGIKIGSADALEHEYGAIYMNRVITIVLTREVFRSDSDSDAFIDAQKALAEDVYSVQSLLYSYNGQGVDPSIMQVQIGSVSEMNVVNQDKQNSLAVEVNFTFTIKENL